MKPWSLSEVDERAATAGFTRVERRIEGDRIVALCFRTAAHHGDAAHYRPSDS
jgi:hypothetical protein